jgi:hypothetical protein
VSGAEEHSGRPASRACRPDSEISGADHTTFVSKSVTNSIRSLVARTGLTIRETLRYTTEHEGEVLRSCTDEDLGERGISLHEAGVHCHPLESHDGLYERHVRAVKARDDMHEGVKPLSKLWDR